MTVKLLRAKPAELEADLVVLFVREGKETVGVVAKLAPEDRDAVRERAKRLQYKAKVAATLLVQRGGRDLLLVGVGDASSSEQWRRAGAAVRAGAAAARASSVAVALDDASRPADAVSPVLEGYRLADYSFDKYRNKKEGTWGGARSLTLAAAALGDDARARAEVTRTEAVCDAVAFARDLVNEMSSAKPPSHLATVARGVARGGELRCEVWQGERLRREKMNGILAVSAGSRHGGALIHLTYTPKKRTRARVALVGKGITFDSGGLSLKPAKSMETMKLDMAGAAAVLGVMKALPALRPNVEVHGFVAAAENMPGGGAQKPGDVIRYRNGVTAEVLNTDAEGRLVLADALCLAVEKEPDFLVDAATLTGACMVALGTRVAGLLTNDGDLADRLLAASSETGEALWRLPLVEEYAEDIRSAVADIKNVGGGHAGTITAALFLQHFVGKTKWAHLDIAGPAFTEKPLAYAPKGGTGYGVRLLLSYLESLG